MNKKVITIIAAVLIIIVVIVASLLIFKDKDTKGPNDIMTNNTQGTVEEKPPLSVTEAHNQIDDMVKEVENNSEEPIEVDQDKLEETKEVIRKEIESGETQITEITGIEENGTVSFETTTGIGLYDPDDTAIVAREGMTEAEIEAVQKEYEEKSTIDESIPDPTEEELAQQSNDFQQATNDLWGGLDFGDQHLPENNEAAGGHTEGWTAIYR